MTAAVLKFDVTDDIRAEFPDAAILEAAERIASERLHRLGEISSAVDARRLLVQRLAHCERECFCALFLDNHHHVIAFEILTEGTINAASVYPRELVRRVITHNAAAVIVAHNHPSGHPHPSEADRRMTDRIQDALALIDTRVIDHFIVGGTTCLSFAEEGLI